MRGSSSGKVDIPELPEECIAHIITYTSPKDACVSALVSKMFQSAADSNDVWEKFLPMDYKDIMSRSTVPINLMDYPSMKQLYLRLCSSSDPILLKGGTKSLSLEKKTGKKCLTVGARELGIAWGENPTYWEWRSNYVPDTRMLSTNAIYGVYLVIKHADGTYGLEDIPVDASVTSVGGGTTSGSRNVHLVHSTRRRTRRHSRRREPKPIVEGAYFPTERGDGWMEIELGEFYNDQGEDGEIHVCVKEVKDLNSKRGLIVEGIEFRAKTFGS